MNKENKGFMLLLLDGTLPTDFNNYQRATKETYTIPLNSIESIGYLPQGLAGEAGEVANITKKIIRDDDGIITDESRLKVAKELGDVLWYIAMLCNEFDLKLEDIAQSNIEKLYSRKQRGKISGSGDDR